MDNTAEQYGFGEQEFRHIQMIIDNIDAVIAVCAPDKTVLMVNDQGIAMLSELGKMTADQLIGHHIDTVLAPVIYDGRSIIDLVFRTKKPMRRNIRYKKDNVDKTVLYTAIPILDDDVLKFIVATGRDVTELIRMEEQLMVAERLNQYYFDLVQKLSEYEKTDEIVFTSKKMETVLHLASRAARSDASVFITGESGVGKEIIARYIHRQSERRDKPFVAVNCAAIPKELIESELFGYAEGAFTGSRRGGKRGLLEEADGGSFFLDEIGDLPPDVQGKLLRVVQEAVLRPVGSNRDVRIDVRYLSATNLPNEKLLDNEVFRQDLRYRLSVIPITIPPIRERKEDIIPLVEHYLEFFNEKYGKNIRLSAGAYGYLCSLPWRGNIRQIKNLVERIVILSEKGSLMKEELEPIVSLDIDSEKVGDLINVNGVLPLSEARQEMENKLIELALAEHQTVPKAAKALGVPPSTIYRKLKKQ